ncbi:hypothetical protein [Hymenobacter wooponensis]|uniref:Uncharacterized protein n=1 Tax=Hymenobacter wooponensis TaxID=1525360 RepID=A0A4Z0MUE8_9BACT|nr:hypothetical protein [Hymenobacter wooponensis]TGD83254.1 hypothetical protein EU557_05600 [Hymenobacter wooponensis]
MNPRIISIVKLLTAITICEQLGSFVLMKNPNSTSASTPKPIAQLAAKAQAPVQPVAAFRPVQPEDLTAKRRKAYPYLF